MASELSELKRKPIPPSAEVMARKRGYREEVRIDFAGALAKEACVEVRSLGLAGDNHYNTPRNPPYYVSVPGSIAELHLRKSVAAKLVEITQRTPRATIQRSLAVLGTLNVSKPLFESTSPS